MCIFLECDGLKFRCRECLWSGDRCRTIEMGYLVFDEITSIGTLFSEGLEERGVNEKLRGNYVLTYRTGNDDAIETGKRGDSGFPFWWRDDLEHGYVFILAENATNEFTKRLREFRFRGSKRATRRGELH